MARNLAESRRPHNSENHGRDRDISGGPASRDAPDIAPDARAYVALAPKRGTHRRQELASGAVLRHAGQRARRVAALGELRIVGAEYSLETGVVDFFA